MTHHTAAEIKASNIALMGVQLGTIYNALWQELAAVYHVWGEYEELFGKKKSRIELLNQAAPSFFRLVQDTLFEAIILHIARLTDRPRPGGKSALTIQQLSAVIADARLKKEVDRLIEVALTEGEFCRDWRNRHIAHRDLDLATSDAATPLRPATREKVRRVLVAIADVLNEISHHHKDGGTTFDAHIVREGAEALLYVIDSGVKAEEARRRRRLEGRWDDDDLAPRHL